MRQFNRIIGFVAVGFVLAFMGKVNKMGLYTAYFKTIADVEVRNSTALDHGDVQYAAATTKVEVPSNRNLDGGNAALAAVPASVLAASPVADAAGIDAQDIPLRMRCFHEVAPRAPGA